VLLVCGLGFAYARPGMTRAVVGAVFAFFVLLFLLAGSWMMFGNPLIVPDERPRADGKRPWDYLPSYYLSYLAALAALCCFGIESWLSWRGRPPEKPDAQVEKA